MTFAFGAEPVFAVACTGWRLFLLGQLQGFQLEVGLRAMSHVMWGFRLEPLLIVTPLAMQTDESAAEAPATQVSRPQEHMVTRHNIVHVPSAYGRMVAKASMPKANVYQSIHGHKAQFRSCSKSMPLAEHPCQNHDISFVFQEHAVTCVTTASMPKT